MWSQRQREAQSSFALLSGTVLPGSEGSVGTWAEPSSPHLSREASTLWHLSDGRQPALQPGQALPPGPGPALLPTKSSCSQVPGAVALAQDLTAWPGTPSFLAGHHESSAGSQGCWLTYCGRVGDSRSGRGRVRTGLSREGAPVSSRGDITVGTGKMEVWGGMSWLRAGSLQPGTKQAERFRREHTKTCDRKPHPQASSLTPCRD